MAKTKKVLILLFFFIIVLSYFIFLPNALAQTATTPTTTSGFKYQVPFGSLPFGEFSVTPSSFGEYAKALYVFGSAVVVVLAIVMIMYSGMQWITSGGDSGKITKAKEGIMKAIIGLIIALFAVFILQTVSPGAVDLKSLSIDTVVCCSIGGVNKFSTSATQCTQDGGTQVDLSICNLSSGGPQGLDTACSSQTCPAGLYCQIDAAGATSGKCKSKASFGQSCNSGDALKGSEDDVCASGNCDRNICVPKIGQGANGNPCTDWKQCPETSSCKCDPSKAGYDDTNTTKEGPGCQTGICAPQISESEFGSRICDGWEVSGFSDNVRCQGVAGGATCGHLNVGKCSK